jgi:ribosome-associated protein
MMMLLQLLPVAVALLLQLSIRTITTTTSSVSAFVLYESQLQQVTIRSRRHVTMFAKLPVSSSSSSSSESGNPLQQQQQPYAPPQPKQQRSNQQGKRDMINLMYGEQEQLPVVVSTENENSHHEKNLVVLDDTELDLIHTIVRAADGRKAENIVALYVAHITTLTSVLIVVSGNSRPQNQAIGTAIRTAVTARSMPTSTNVPPPPSIEGTAESGWMILDYGSIMVHIMTPKSRLFYNIEGKWKQPTLLVVNNRNENDQYPNDATTGRASTTTTTTAVTATAIPLDLSQILIPNSSAPSLSPLPGSTNAISPSLDPTDQLDEEEEEDETDPFWS